MRSLLEKIERKSARVVVIGIGYVGLPLVAELARAGFRTHCTTFPATAAKCMVFEAVPNPSRERRELLRELVVQLKQTLK